jgi:ubiquinone/menaquinone biosynthesis C-methylase UbiE
MRLNAIEKALMNNPLRAASQRYYEGALLQRLGGMLPPHARVLEVGCGRGVGIEIIHDRFGAAEVHGFDLDPDMVQRARRRLNRRHGGAHLFVGDAAQLPCPDASYDAVFDFGIVHHVPQWRLAIAEIARVLRPGGRFYFLEVTRQALDRLLYRVLLEHPTHDRFDAQTFISESASNGIEVGSRTVSRFFGDFVFGVGIKMQNSPVRR